MIANMKLTAMLVSTVVLGAFTAPLHASEQNVGVTWSHDGSNTVSMVEKAMSGSGYLSTEYTEGLGLGLDTTKSTLNENKVDFWKINTGISQIVLDGRGVGLDLYNNLNADVLANAQIGTSDIYRDGRGVGLMPSSEIIATFTADQNSDEGTWANVDYAYENMTFTTFQNEGPNTEIYSAETVYNQTLVRDGRGVGLQQASLDAKIPAISELSYVVAFSQ